MFAPHPDPAALATTVHTLAGDVKRDNPFAATASSAFDPFIGIGRVAPHELRKICAAHMRGSACGIVMSNFPRTCSSRAKLTRRYIIVSQSGQIPIRLPSVAVTDL